MKKIQECFKLDRVYYSKHARDEMEDEESGEIKDEEVFEAVAMGKSSKIIRRTDLIQVVLFMAEQSKNVLCMRFVHIRKMKSYQLS